MIWDSRTMFVGFFIMFLYSGWSLGGGSGDCCCWCFCFLCPTGFVLALSGVAAVGMGMAAGEGVAAYFGFPYSPINGFVPFLCLGKNIFQGTISIYSPKFFVVFILQGIGIDDMFVIVQCWRNLGVKSLQDGGEAAAQERLSEAVGRTMRHAGVAITVTSVTDVVAFGVGAFTVTFFYVFWNFYFLPYIMIYVAGAAWSAILLLLLRPLRFLHLRFPSKM